MAQSEVKGMKVKNTVDNTQVDASLKKTASGFGTFKRAAEVSFKKAVGAAKQAGEGIKAAMKAGFNVAKYAAVGGGVIIGTLSTIVKKAADAGDRIDKMRKRTGLTAEMLSRLDHAAKLSDTSLEDLAKGVKTMQRAALEAQRGTGTYVRIFEELGISATDVNGELKTTEQLFEESTTALAALESHTKKAALAQELFGRSGINLLPILSDGKDGLNAMMKEAGELGYIWSEETSAAAAALNDDLTRLWTSVTGISTEIGVALMPHVKQVTESMVAWYKANREMVQTNLKAWLATAGESLSSFWTTVSEWSADGGFMLWWERAKAAVLGFKVVLAGVQSTLDMAISGYHELAASAAFWKGDSANEIRHKGKAKQYRQQAGTRAVEATREYTDQAQRVKEMEYAYETRSKQRAAQAQVAAPGGGQAINVNITNSLVGEVTRPQGEAIAAKIAELVQRGKDGGLGAAVAAKG